MLKKMKFFVGLAAFSLIVGFNALHALNGYGVKEGKLHVEILEQDTGGGGTGSGSGSGTVTIVPCMSYLVSYDVKDGTGTACLACQGNDYSTCMWGCITYRNYMEFDNRRPYICD